MWGAGGDEARNTAPGPVVRKWVKFNPGLSKTLVLKFLVRRNSYLKQLTKSVQPSRFFRTLPILY